MTPAMVGVMTPSDVDFRRRKSSSGNAGDGPTLTPMPNQPKTPQRTVRVPDEVWERAKARAEARGETVSDVVRRALERYGRAK